MMMMMNDNNNSSEFLYLAGQTVFDAVAAALSEFDGRRAQETLNATLDGERLHIPQSPAFTHERSKTPQ